MDWVCILADTEMRTPISMSGNCNQISNGEKILKAWPVSDKVVKLKLLCASVCAKLCCKLSD